MIAQGVTKNLAPKLNALKGEVYMSKKLLVTAAATVALLAGSNAFAAGHSIKIGLITTLEGTYTVLGEDGVRGAKTALEAFGGKAGG